MSQMKNEVKDLIEELGHVQWAANHPAILIDKTLLALFQRCEAVLRAVSEHDDKDVVCKERRENVDCRRT